MLDLKKEIRVKKTEPTSKAPVIRTFLDAHNNETNQTTCSGNMAILSGSNLRFDRNDLMQGVFFVPENKNHEPVRVKSYSDITPLSMILLTPGLKPGNYRIVVKAIPVNCKKIVQGESGFILEVK